jgi:hypothetical protein
MADRSRRPARRTRVLATGLLAVVAAELVIAAVTALPSGISWAAAVGSFTVTNGAMELGVTIANGGRGRRYSLVLVTQSFTPPGPPVSLRWLAAGPPLPAACA